MRIESRRKKFHISIGSVLAAFLLIGGFQWLITACRDPLGHAIVRLLNSFLHSNALRFRERPTDWVFIIGSLAVGLVFVVLGMLIGARTLRSRDQVPE